MFRLRVLECHPHDRRAWEARYVRARGRHVWELRDHLSGCEVISMETFSGAALLIAPLRPLLVIFQVRWMTRVSLRVLAAYVERGAANAAD